MFKKKKKEDTAYSTLIDRNRTERIEALESEREDVVFQLEEIMKDIAQASKKRSLGRRKKKLGKAPNDRRMSKSE